MSTRKNLVSVSSAPIAKLGGYRYYDLPGNLEVMEKIMRESVVDGFELQLLPEWDDENPPLTDAQYADWGETPKYAPEDILTLLEGHGLPVLSVHANRDIGCYLCSERGRDLEKGRRLISETLSLASDLGAGVTVFHLWDTWKTDFDDERLEAVFSETTAQHKRKGFRGEHPHQSRWAHARRPGQRLRSHNA